MKLLLDTHVWIWSLDRPNKLSARVSRALSDVRNERWLSPISLWEIVLLADAGRIRTLPEPIAWIRSALRTSAVREAPITHEIALASRRLDLEHDDPADRFLVATAEVLGLTLVTADERLLASRRIATLANR